MSATSVSDPAAAAAVATAPGAPTRPPLAALLPPPGTTLGADDILARFVSYVGERGLELFPAQEEAILEILAGKHIVLSTPTGSGKSLVAEAFHFKLMAEGRVSFYTAPVKALVNEKFFALCQAFGPDKVGMLTGDAAVNRQAPLLCCTAEVLANLSLRDARLVADGVVMDEFHYYGDRERGIAWQLPLLTLPRATFLLMSATLGDTTAIRRSLTALSGRDTAEIRTMQRPVPLDHEWRETPLHETIDDFIRAGRAPIYLVNFTQRAAAERAQDLMSLDLCSKPEKEALREALSRARFTTPYGKELQRFLRQGIGIHHAGLLPRYRRLVEQLAQRGMLKVVSGTDTLGVGVNIPIRTVLFTQLCKFDGEKTGILSVRDLQQIAGRAGRKGFDERGWVVAQAPEHVVENKRLAQKAAGGKKVTMKSPPPKGYVHFDRGTFERLAGGQPEPLESRFEVSHGMLLAVLQGAAGEERPDGGYRRLLDIVARSHGNDHTRRKAKRTAAACFRRLRHADILRLGPRRRGGRGAMVSVSPDLQHDFSLHQTLSLYLVDTLPRLDRAAPSYALDVVTLVESILENPQPVLFAQLSRAKDTAMAAMKAAGVEYAERIERLDEVEYPKPLRELVYETFNAFSDRHPWVGAENIRPKAVAREMLEGFVSFNDYVRDYGLARSEGVLLRYLSQAWKTLMQNVPEAFRDDAVEDAIATLGTLVRTVDASLLEEWEGLRDPLAAARPAGVPAPALPHLPQPRDLAAEPKALAARVRAEMHALLRALSKKDWEEAAAAIHQADESPPEGAWTPERLAAALAPFFAEHAVLRLDPEARHPHNTRLEEIAPRRFRVTQRLFDPEGDDDWVVEAMVDLSGPRADDAPLVELVRIGL